MAFDIELKQVSFDYGAQPTLIDVTFVVDKHALVGLVGPNGSGKTTLLKLILGLLPLTKGQITVLDKPVVKLQHVRQFIGYVPQNVKISKEFPVSVLDMVRMARYRIVGPCRRLGTQDEQAVEWALSAVRMSEYRHEIVGELSDGLQQRAAIARALAKEPALLCLDEPASSLDVSSRRLLYQLLRLLREERKITLFVVSHDLQLLAEQADKLILIDHHVITQGCPTDVLKHVQFDRLEAEFAGCREHDHHGSL